MRAKEYKPLHKVMLVVTGVQGYVPGDVRKHNEEIFRISRVHRVKRQKNTVQRLVYYELDGLVSKKGIPYAIPKDWLYDIGVWVGDDV